MGEPQTDCFHDCVLAGVDKGSWPAVDLLPDQGRGSLLGLMAFGGPSPHSSERGIRQVGFVHLGICSSVSGLGKQWGASAVVCFLLVGRGSCGRSWRPPRTLHLLSRRRNCQIPPPPIFQRDPFPFSQKQFVEGGLHSPPSFSFRWGSLLSIRNVFVNWGRAWGVALASSLCASKAFHAPPLGNGGCMEMGGGLAAVPLLLWTILLVGIKFFYTSKCGSDVDLGLEWGGWWPSNCQMETQNLGGGQERGTRLPA